MPGLSPLISYARSVELGEPVPADATRAAARSLAAQDLETLSNRLRQAGLDAHEASLRDFFSVLGAVLDRALAGDMTSAQRIAQGDAFGAAYTSARVAQSEICDTLDSAGGPTPNATGRPDRVGGDGQGARVLGPTSPYETPVAINAQRFVSVFLAILSVAVILHYALLWRASAVRRRRLVTIPAVLRSGDLTVQGKLSILDLYGAKFVAADALRMPIKDRPNPTIEAEDMTFSVSILSGGRIAQHLQFNDPLSPQLHARLLEGSLTPPRRDPMARDRSTGTSYRYGQAHLGAGGDLAR
ncbi:MAG: hypothetical protein AAGM84_02855 [Pseudomonadota bacterium]